MSVEPPPLAGSCVGSQIVHVVGGAVAGCTLDEDGPDACQGVLLRHEGDPVSCTAEWRSCPTCGLTDDF